MRRLNGIILKLHLLAPGLTEVCRVHPHVCLSLCKPSNIFIFFRTTGPISTEFGTKYPWLKGFKFIQMKGHALSQGEIIRENQKQIDNF